MISSGEKKMEKTFDEYKKEVQSKLPEGFVLDEDKLEKLKEAYDKGEKINEQDFAKKANQNKDTQKSPKKTTTVNEGEIPEETTNTNSEDASWKEKYAKEWKNWSIDNHLEFQDASVPTKGDALNLRFYEDKSKDYAAEITYNSPYSISMRGSNGNIPDSKYFEKAVNMAINNGTAIEFGAINSPEFKAKLLAACYKQGNAQVINAPTEEEIATWPDNLKKMIEEAKLAGQQPVKEQPTPSQEQTPPKQETKPELTPAMKRIAELRKQIQTRNANLKEAEEAAMAAGGELRQEDKEAISKEGMSAEELKLRELRGQAKAGDKKAAHELDARRYNTMTDEFKYKRLTKEENGKEVFVKDDNGNYIYETDEKGKRIKTDAYQAFLTKAGKDMSR